MTTGLVNFGTAGSFLFFGSWGSLDVVSGGLEVHFDHTLWNKKKLVSCIVLICFFLCILIFWPSFYIHKLKFDCSFYIKLDGIPVTERVKIATHQMIICKFEIILQ